MMNRRQFAVSTGAMLGICVGGRPAHALTREAGSAMRSFVSNGPVTFLSAFVGEYLEDERAEAARLRFVAAAAEDYDHRYDPSVSVAELPLPDPLQDMPGSLILTTIVVGAAAVRRDYLTGVFRRNSIVWVLKAFGAGPWEMDDVIIDLMNILAEKRISSLTPGVNDDGFQTGGLWDLLPGAGDVPDGYTMRDERSPVIATPGPA